MGENVSTLAISERCHYYDIILKTPKRHRVADGPLSADSVEKVGLPKLPDH
jgi:hypothetical protein